MNVVIYARFSSHSQTEQSIEGQLQICYEFAKKNNYVVIGEYIDRALSGTNDHRPQFQKMIEESNKKQFQGILVYQLDRFARNRYDSAIYKSRLKKNGVRVLSARENITDDASGILVEGLLESMAEYYSAELSQKILRGMLINSEKFLFTGGRIPFGYTLVEKRYEINPKTAPIVQRIFDLYADGKTIKEITTYLNSQGFKTSKNEPFNKNSLHSMLINKRYIGTYIYKNKETQNAIPSIISEELFNKVQEIMLKNKKAPARSKSKCEYLLTTKLFCGKCREMMTGVSGTSKTGIMYYYYTCNGNKKKACSKKPVRKDYIENLVVDECRKFLTDENIAIISGETIALCKKERENSNLKLLKKQLKDCDRRTNNLIAAISECNNDSVRKPIYAEIAKLETEKQIKEKQIAIEEAGQLNITESEVKFFLTQLRKGSINELKYRKTLINVFVNAVYLYDDKITYIFNIGEKPVTVDIKLLDEIEQSNSETIKSSFLNHIAPPQKVSNHAGCWLFSFL